MSDETPESAPENTPAEVAESKPRLEGFAEAVMAGMPGAVKESEAEPTEAVETSEAEETPPESEAPESEASEPEKADDAEETGDDAEETKAEQTVNFDGFDDDQKTTFDGLLKDGHVTPEFVEAERLKTLFQANYTKKTMALASDRKAFEAEKSKLSDDIELLNTIRTNKQYNAAWERMTSGEFDADAEDDDGGELVSRGEAERIADARLKAREAEKEARSAKQQEQYEAKVGEITTAMRESMETLSIDQETLVAYLEAEDALLPPGTDPILHYDPSDLQYRVSMRHQVALAEARAKAAETQASKTASKNARAAKQSLPPARRVSSTGETTPWQRTKAALGVEPGLANVTGIGNIPGAR